MRGDADLAQVPPQNQINNMTLRAIPRKVNSRMRYPPSTDAVGQPTNLGRGRGLGGGINARAGQVQTTLILPL